MSKNANVEEYEFFIDPEESLKEFDRIMEDENKIRIQKERQIAKTKEEMTSSPRVIKEYLDKHIVGQEYAKRILAVAAYNHQKIIKNPRLRIEKSNIMMIGPSGCGKTYMIKVLADILNVPYVIVSSTSMTANGYAGEDAESALVRLYRKAYNQANNCCCEEERVMMAKARAENGIVFIDEIDKKAVRRSDVTSRDVCGESVQQALLKLVEGTTVSLQGTADCHMGDPILLNTKNILFIVSGAFEGLDKIISKRLGNNGSSINLLGGNRLEKLTSYNQLIDDVVSEDVRQFGMLQEFVGRFPVICPLHLLTEEEIVKILTEPENSIVEQYQKLMEIDHVKLIFEDAALKEVAKNSMRNNTGARGLRNQMEKVLLDTMYNSVGDKKGSVVVITAEDVRKAS